MVFAKKSLAAAFLILFSSMAFAVGVDCSNLIPVDNCSRILTPDCPFYCEAAGPGNGEQCGPSMISAGSPCSSTTQECQEGTCGCPESLQCSSNALLECCPPDLTNNPGGISSVECRGDQHPENQSQNLAHIEVVNPLSCSILYGQCCKTTVQQVDCEALCDELIEDYCSANSSIEACLDYDPNIDDKDNKCDPDSANDACIFGTINCECSIIGTVPITGGDYGGPDEDSSAGGIGYLFRGLPGNDCLPYANLRAEPPIGQKPLDVIFTATCLCFVSNPGSTTCIPEMCESCLLDFADTSSPDPEVILPWDNRKPHLYQNAGTYYPNVTAKDSRGNTATDYEEITVTEEADSGNRPPVADATVGEDPIGYDDICSHNVYAKETTVFPGALVILYSDRDGPDSDCDPSYAPDGHLVAYSWECSSTSPAPCPSLRYPATPHPSFTAGADGEVYQIRLTVYDNFFATGDDTVTVRVSSPGPGEGALKIALNVEPVPLELGTSFTTAEALVEWVVALEGSSSGGSAGLAGPGADIASFDAPASVYIKAEIRDAVSNNVVGTVYTSDHYSLSHLFKFDDPDDAGPLLAPLGENTLPVGNYRLTVNAYEYISDVWLGRKSLDFQIFNPDMPVFVPELGLLAVILVAAAVLFIYKRKK